MNGFNMLFVNGGQPAMPQTDRGVACSPVRQRLYIGLKTAVTASVGIDADQHGATVGGWQDAPHLAMCQNVQESITIDANRAIWNDTGVFTLAASPRNLSITRSLTHTVRFSAGSPLRFAVVRASLPSIASLTAMFAFACGSTTSKEISHRAAVERSGGSRQERAGSFDASDGPESCVVISNMKSRGFPSWAGGGTLFTC